MRKPEGISIQEGDGSSRTLFLMRKGESLEWAVSENGVAIVLSADPGICHMTDPARFLMPLVCIEHLTPFVFGGSPVRVESRMTIGSNDYVIVHVYAHMTIWEPRMSWVES